MVNGKVVHFCKRRNCCPTVKLVEDGVVIGGKDEGYTKFTKENFKDFVESAKNGDFDQWTTN